jgi:hypothetical protein
MILMFSPKEIREQIAHARNSAQHRSLAAPSATPPAPSLHLTRQDGRIYLVSSGMPESKARAYAAGFGPGEPRPEGGEEHDLATTGDADFVESIAVDTFKKALDKPEVVVVVTRSYINVLGGQPERPPTAMLSRSFGATSRPKKRASPAR